MKFITGFITDFWNYERAIILVMDFIKWCQSDAHLYGDKEPIRLDTLLRRVVEKDNENHPGVLHSKFNTTS